jgi:uncharacterized membrane protein YfcA
VGGATLAIYAPTHIIAVIFGFVLIFSAALSLKKKEEVLVQAKAGRFATALKLDSSYPTAKGEIKYSAQNIPGGFFMMAIAGLISGLLGIGSGALKVIAMDHFMRLPFKVSTTTSNFMIGVTAAASAGIYMHRGYINPGLSMPVVLGVIAGAFLGSKILVKSETKWLRIFFAVIIVFLAFQMIYNGITGQI